MSSGGKDGAHRWNECHERSAAYIIARIKNIYKTDNQTRIKTNMIILPREQWSGAGRWLDGEVFSGRSSLSRCLQGQQRQQQVAYQKRRYDRSDNEIATVDIAAAATGGTTACHIRGASDSKCHHACLLSCGLHHMVNHTSAWAHGATCRYDHNQPITMDQLW